MRSAKNFNSNSAEKRTKSSNKCPKPQEQKYTATKKSGEQVGRALVGMEFETLQDREACHAEATRLLGTTIQGIHELPDVVRRRVLDRMSPMEK